MRSFIFSAALLSAACVSAVQINAPTKNEKVDLADDGYEVKFDTVSSDPTKAHLFIVNQQGGHTPYSKDLGEIDLTKGSYKVDAIKDLPADTGYQFNLVSTASQNTGILAQSQQFEVEESDDDDSSSSSSAAASSTASGSSSATAATTTGSSSASSTATTLTSATSAPSGPTSSGSSASHSGSATASGTGAASSNTTVPSSAHKLAAGSLVALAFGAIALIA